MHKFHLTGTESGLEFDIELEPDQRVYCFIGKNGVGKTCLLEEMARVLLFTHMIGQKPRQANPSSLLGLLHRGNLPKDLAKIDLRVPDGTLNGQQIKAPFHERWSFIKLGQLKTPAVKATDSCQKPLVFVSAALRASIDNIGAAALRLVGDRSSVFADTITRTIRSANRQPVETSSVPMWFATRLLLDPNFVVGIKMPYHEVIALVALLAEFDPQHFSKLFRKSDSVEIGVSFEEGQIKFMKMPIDRLASGYTALLKILQEVIACIAAWEAMRDSTDILGSDAIVFIDEIDAHLHPRWQRNLLPFLKQKFPNATFIVTTHSPLVARDTDPGEAYELVRDDKKVTARRLGSPRDWYLSDVLSDAFHVDLPQVGTEGSNDSPPLLELMLDFSSQVKRFAASRDDAERQSAMSLYDTILARLPDDDPRRRNLSQLRQLLG